MVVPVTIWAGSAALGVVAGGPPGPRAESDSHDPHPRPHRRICPGRQPPVVRETYAAIQEALDDTSSFDDKTRESIGLAVGNVDDGSYCQAGHVGHVGHVNDSTWQAALAAGWTDTRMTETSAVAALNLSTNYFNHLRPDRT